MTPRIGGVVLFLTSCHSEVSSASQKDPHNLLPQIALLLKLIPAMLNLLLATTNRGKIEEISALLADLAVNLVSPADLGLDIQVEESGETYAENASLKAKAFAAASVLPALADDSGLEVDALGGAPGLHSARFSPLPGATDADRRAHLLRALAGKPQPWTAQFRSTICLAYAAPKEGATKGVSGVLRPPKKLHTFFAEGICHGQISPDERGQGGFGYDRIFIIEGEGRSMAELSLAEKNRLSHRAKAVANIKEVLTQIVGSGL